MTKSLFSKHLSTNLFPFCVFLCPTVSVGRKDGAETTGNKRKQIGHRSKLKLFRSNNLQICFRDSCEGE